MSKDIKIILDGAHGKNNLYTKRDNKFKIHSETINLINILYKFESNEKNKILIFGEAISEQYTINFNGKEYMVIGEDAITELFLYKLIDGFCTLVLPNDYEFKIIIKNRLEDKILLNKEKLKDNIIFQKYTDLLNSINLSDTNLTKINDLIEIIELFSNKDAIQTSILEYIKLILKNILENVKSETNVYEQLYSYRLELRDYNIVKYIYTNFSNYNNIVIIMGENHKFGFKKYINPDDIKMSITMPVVELKESILLEEQIMNGGNKLKKYKFTMDLINYLNI